VLEELDQKLDGGEDHRVGVEIVGVGSAIDHGIRAPLVEEQFLERDRGRTMYWASASRVSGEPAGMRIDAFTEKPLWVHSTMFLANRWFSSFRSRKNAMTLWRKQPLIFARSTIGTWTNLPSRRGKAREGAAKQLWMMESIFRTAKSILETRLIYHKDDYTIRGVCRTVLQAAGVTVPQTVRE
jgi:hypothetical protein